jgi:hypothetical protein
MLRAIFALLFICFTSSTFCQYKKGPFTPLTKEDYLLLSKREKTVAWLLLGAGSTLILAAATTSTLKGSSFVHPFITGSLGVLSVSASIPLFILSGKHKKHAHQR